MQHNPYAAPAAPAPAYYPGVAPYFARADGKNLVLSKAAFLPNVCVKCGAREPTPILRRRRNYTFVPWYGRFFGIIGYLLTQKKATLDLPVCPPCNHRYGQSVMAMWLSVAPVVVGFAALFLGAAVDSSALVLIGLLFIFSVLIVPLVVYFAFALPRLLPAAVHIDDQTITLSRVSPFAIEATLYVANANAQYGYAPAQPQAGAPYGPPPPTYGADWPPR